MAGRIYNILFLCTGNSARSVMAECAMNRWGRGRFAAYSAGSHPRGEIHPMTLELLRALQYDTAGLRSKSWDEFALPGSPRFDFVFTVCDQARGEVCPLWPGQPITAHWDAADPAAFSGSAEEQRRFFLRIYNELESRAKIVSNLPLDSVDRSALEPRLKEIGQPKPA
ncbi:MAG: arsenate reductase ArsC [Candidatus Binataceae bacterium]